VPCYILSLKNISNGKDQTVAKSGPSRKNNDEYKLDGD